MDKIIIDSLRLFAYHGVNPEEQEDGQFFILDIEADIPLSKAGESDDLNDTVSYAQMIKCARRVFSSQKDKLIERAARRVADALLEEFPPIEGVRVTCKKPDAPMKADFGFAAVSIYRERNINRKDCRFYGKLYAGSYRDRFEHGGQTEEHKRRCALSVPPAKDENNSVLPRL